MNLHVFQDSVPPRAIDMPMNCPSGSRIWGIAVCLITWLTFLLGGLDLRSEFNLLGDLAPFSGHSDVLCIVILKILGCFTSLDMCVCHLFNDSLLDTVLAA